MAYDFKTNKPNLKQLKDAYDHATEKGSVEDFKWHDDVHKDSASSIKKATDHGTISGEHYTVARGGKTTADFQQWVDHKKELESTIKDVEADGNDASKLKDLLKKRESEIGKHHETMESELAEANRLVVKAKADTLAEQAKVISKIESEYVDALAKLDTANKADRLPLKDPSDAAKGRFTYEECKARIDSVRDAAKDHTKELYKEKLEGLNSRGDGIKKVADEIESVTGKKVNLNKKLGADLSKTMEQGAAGEMKFWERMTADSRHLKNGAGVLLILPKLAEMIGLIDKPKDANGQEVSSTGKNVAALGGVALLVHSALTDPKLEKGLVTALGRA